MLAACPAYLKSHSYGEYVFDWAWAEAYHRHGLSYYPKLLVAVPFTPVPAAVRWRVTMRRARLHWTGSARAGHRHLVPARAAGRCRRPGRLAAAGCLARQGVQFHWTQDGDDPAPDFFSALLARLQRDKRKKIQQEQRRVSEAGIGFTALQGPAITPEDWDFFYRCYQLTYRAHHSTALPDARDFFARMAAEMPEHWLLFVASRA